MKEYMTPAIFIRAYDITENITTSANVAGGSEDIKDDTTLDMSGEL